MQAVKPVAAPASSERPVAEASSAEVRELVRRAQRGDVDAFDGIYRWYAREVFAFLYFRTRDRYLAEDLTSETFLRALRGIGRFQWQGADLAAWLVTIARNLLLDHRKSARYRRDSVVADVTALGKRIQYAKEDPERMTLGHLSTAAAIEKLREIPEDQRRCLVLRFIGDLTVPEVAQMMGRTVDATKALQHRAMRALRGKVVWTP